MFVTCLITMTKGCLGLQSEDTILMVGEFLPVMVTHCESRIMRQLVTLYPQSGSRGR